jgi:hypothetical protein
MYIILEISDKKGNFQELGTRSSLPNEVSLEPRWCVEVNGMHEITLRMRCTECWFWLYFRVPVWALLAMDQEVSLFMVNHYTRTIVVNQHTRTMVEQDFWHNVLRHDTALFLQFFLLYCSLSGYLPQVNYSIISKL